MRRGRRGPSAVVPAGSGSDHRAGYRRAWRGTVRQSIANRRKSGNPAEHRRIARVGTHWRTTTPETAPGGNRTHTALSGHRILSPKRLPFRHGGRGSSPGVGKRTPAGRRGQYWRDRRSIKRGQRRIPVSRYSTLACPEVDRERRVSPADFYRAFTTSAGLRAFTLVSVLAACTESGSADAAEFRLDDAATGLLWP